MTTGSNISPAQIPRTTNCRSAWPLWYRQPSLGGWLKTVALMFSGMSFMGWGTLRELRLRAMCRAWRAWLRKGPPLLTLQGSQVRLQVALNAARYRVLLILRGFVLPTVPFGSAASRSRQ